MKQKDWKSLSAKRGKNKLHGFIEQVHFVPNISSKLYKFWQISRINPLGE